MPQNQMLFKEGIYQFIHSGIDLCHWKIYSYIFRYFKLCAVGACGSCNYGIGLFNNYRQQFLVFQK